MSTAQTLKWTHQAVSLVFIPASLCRLFKKPMFRHILVCGVPWVVMGARGSVVVKALCRKPEGRWFETRRVE
jgi:hypothetical protein